MPKRKTILVAPLYWGLGHATRCIPIIQALADHGFDVVLASDGPALLLLQKEFPEMEAIELPSYNISYPKDGRFFKWKLLRCLPQIRSAVTSEKEIIQKLVAAGSIHGIISDNRFGIWSEKVPSVFVTHQINVLSGSTSFFSSKINQHFIKKFDVCWVPDTQDALTNLSGKLAHIKGTPFPTEYIGVLSRMQKISLPIETDILVLLSGPEPQRSMLEEILKNALGKSEKRVLMVRGIVEQDQKVEIFKNIKVVNFMTSKALETAINQSKIVISRSGYTTIMDLATLGKKAFFIPTPGQYEQEYLAKRLKILGVAPYCEQEKFNMEALEEINGYKGFCTAENAAVDFSELFSLFQGE